jgi:septal ring factor EnvC (AmiA/AmiB activator)
MFKKSRKTGIVFNFGTEEYQDYLQRKNTTIELARTKTQLRETQKGFHNLQSELAEVKELLQQVLNRKDT